MIHIFIGNDGLLHYGNARSNLISSKFVTKNYPQDLIPVFSCLAEKQGPEFASEVVERMAKLNKFRPEETVSVMKLCQWSKPSMSKLLQVLHSFENFETDDVQKMANSKKILRGEKLTLSNVLFNRLAKCSESSVRELFDKVLSKEMSFESLIDTAERSVKTGKVLDTLKQISGFKTEEELALNFPKALDQDSLSKFFGAEIRGDKLNAQAQHLSDFWKCIVENKATDNKVLFQTLNDFKECQRDFANYDHVILQLKNLDSELLTTIFDLVQKNEKPHSCLLLLPSEASQFEVLSTLRNSNDKLRVIPIYFRQETIITANNVAENLKQAVFYGRSPGGQNVINRFYDSKSALVDLLANCLFPESRVLYALEGGRFITAHRHDSNFSITYLGLESSVSGLKRKIQVEKLFFDESEVSPPMDQNKNIVEMSSGSSTSPQKYDSPSQHNSSSDSGRGSTLGTPAIISFFSSSPKIAVYIYVFRLK